MQWLSTVRYELDPIGLTAFGIPAPEAGIRVSMLTVLTEWKSEKKRIVARPHPPGKCFFSFFLSHRHINFLAIIFKMVEIINLITYILPQLGGKKISETKS